MAVKPSDVSGRERDAERTLRDPLPTGRTRAAAWPKVADSGWASDVRTGETTLPESILRRSVLVGMAAMTVAAAVGSVVVAAPAYAATVAGSLPLPPLRIP